MGTKRGILPSAEPPSQWKWKCLSWEDGHNGDHNYWRRWYVLGLFFYSKYHITKFSELRWVKMWISVGAFILGANLRKVFINTLLKTNFILTIFNNEWKNQFL